MKLHIDRVVNPVVERVTRSVAAKTRGAISWSSYWSTLISATVETAAPTHVVLTFPTAQPSLTDADFTITGFTVSSASWTGAVLTLVLSEAVIYFNGNLIITFVKTGGTATVTNNVADDGNTIAWFDATEAATITKDVNNRVSALADKTGNTHHLVQADANKQPLATSLGISFNSGSETDELLKTANFTYNQPAKVYLVVKRNTQTSTEFFTDGSVQYRGAILAGANSKTLYYHANSYGATTTLETNRFKVVKALFNGASSSLRVNAYTAVAGNPGTANPGGITIGQAKCYIKEAIYRTTADDAATDTAITNYLIAKHGIDDQSVIGIIGDSMTGDYSPIGLAIREYLPDAATRTYNDCSLVGATCVTQNTAFAAFRDNEMVKVIIIWIGHNDLNNANRYTQLQALINNVRSICHADCKIIINTLVPSTNWSDDPDWGPFNEAIKGNGANAITGVDAVIDLANSALNNGSNGLVPTYSESGDDSGHINAAGRQVVAAIWDAQLAVYGY